MVIFVSTLSTSRGSKSQPPKTGLSKLKPVTSGALAYIFRVLFRFHGGLGQSSGDRVNQILFFVVGVASLVISLLLLSRFIAVWWAIILLLSTPVWFYLALTLGSEMDARTHIKKVDEMQRKLDQIAEEHKTFREQAEKDEKEFEEKQRQNSEVWKKEIESAGEKQD